MGPHLGAVDESPGDDASPGDDVSPGDDASPPLYLIASPSASVTGPDLKPPAMVMTSFGKHCGLNVCMCGGLIMRMCGRCERRWLRYSPRGAQAGIAAAHTPSFYCE